MEILEDMCDDYENLEHIIQGVQKWGAEFGLTYSPSEITEALISLIKTNLVAPYDLKPTSDPPEAIAGEIPIGDMGHLWYWHTDEGKIKHEANDCYFDDQGNLMAQIETE